VTRTFIGFIDVAVFAERREKSVTIDLVDGALSKDEEAPSDEKAMVTVTLSTGRRVTVNSRLLALLRLLADELAREETKVH
jgi:hypothetical protein